MKSIKKNNLKTAFAFGVALITLMSCDRDISDEAQFATFPNTADIFTDNPVGLTDAFFISFDPNVGANTNGFGVDDNVAFEGTSAIRIDVPSADDPDGGFIGGIFKDRGSGRNLTGFDALTFYAKASTTATIALFGFGTDFEENRYAVGLANTTLSTDWKKIIIPIPDPSKLIKESGMFIFSAGSQSTGGSGYTFWMDEIRFEKLGTIAQSRPTISGGIEGSLLTTPGESFAISGLAQTFNVASQGDITVSLAPAYFTFNSSNPDVAVIDDLGTVTIFGTGEATVTADLADVRATGSINVQSFDEVRLISLFSDIYASVPVDNYNGFYLDGFQTTLGGAVDEGGNEIIDYTLLNFVAIEFYGRDGSSVQPIDASQMTHLHIEIRVNENVDPSDVLLLELFNDFTLDTSVSGSFTVTGSELTSNEWVAFDIPLADFTGLNAKNALGALLINSQETISAISLDNIYFYAE